MNTYYIYIFIIPIHILRSRPGAARTILLSHIISARPSQQPLMVRTFLKVYMELGFYFLFLQEQIKDIIIIRRLPVHPLPQTRQLPLGANSTQPRRERCVYVCVCVRARRARAASHSNTKHTQVVPLWSTYIMCESLIDLT